MRPRIFFEASTTLIAFATAAMPVFFLRVFGLATMFCHCGMCLSAAF